MKFLVQTEIRFLMVIPISKFLKSFAPWQIACYAWSSWLWGSTFDQSMHLALLNELFQAFWLGAFAFLRNIFLKQKLNTACMFNLSFLIRNFKYMAFVTYLTDSSWPEFPSYDFEERKVLKRPHQATLLFPHLRSFFVPKLHLLIFIVKDRRVGFKWDYY